jgi:lipopolysaccharide biosynthesis glycosyltransferase
VNDRSAITVAIAADANFAMPLAVCLASISAHSHGRAHRVFVLHDGYPADLVARIEQSVTPDVQLHWLDARAPAVDTAQLPDWLPSAALYRLRITDLLPTDVSRVIYLDADVLVRRPLAELWALDTGDALLAGVRDARYPCFGPVLPWRDLHLAPATPYFNSGVMLIPLRQWREARIGEIALQMLQSRKLQNGDQCALNVVVNGRWLPLGPIWNVQGHHFRGDRALAWMFENPAIMEKALASPAIVHFSQSHHRPWLSESEHPFRGEWLARLSETAWAGYRPPSASRPLPVRVAGRLRRAGQALFRGVTDPE